MSAGSGGVTAAETPSAHPADVFRVRFLADLLTDGMAGQWEQRARVFEWASPRSTDFNGQATTAELAERTQRCRATAAACRAKAEVLRRYGPPDFVTSEVATVLGEVA